MPQHKSTAWPLAWVFIGLIVYASLFPFGPWRDAGAQPWGYWLAPVPRYWTGFDVTVNVLGYMPLGALLAVGLVRSSQAHRAALWPTLIGFVLSASMEALQTYLPARVPSREDCLLNTAGAALGTAVVLLGFRLGLLSRWSRLRERWLVAESRGGLVLLLLWPLALLFPAPVPFGLGQVLERVQATVVEWLEGSFAQDWWEIYEPVSDPLGAGAQAVCVFLGLLIVFLLAFTVLRELRHRLLGIVGLGLAGALATALSAAMSWGPQHAWSWLDLPSQVGMGAAVAVALPLAFAPWRVSASLALLGLGVLLVELNDAPHSPYFAQMLQEWEQGRFMRFNGLSQWLGWCWPYACGAYLVVRLGQRQVKN
ncbi:VanZ family protein [Curvibacter sp. APW13]|uniref:VanZ family protein n=1 Tax=Curvibacter sp. APW13 TaxID=3077236 RepID=UPI0028DEEF51|nr:VanZ family protein [Curvibacter sp. APW13]MDT8990603.1 VanZ family protein [Curvibacter sp. APW13]